MNVAFMNEISHTTKLIFPPFMISTVLLSLYIEREIPTHTLTYLTPSTTSTNYRTGCPLWENSGQ